MDILKLLQGQMSDGLLDTLTRQIGAEDRGQTKIAAEGAISTLLGALAKNASSDQGANSLISALDLDHDGSVLDDALGFLTGTKSPVNKRTSNGMGILSHILGGKQNNVMQLLSQMSGLDNSSIGKLLPVLAPLVMGALGKARSQGDLKVSNAPQVLRQQVKSERNSSIQMDLAKRFLDRDGDGSILDDLADFGMNVLRR